MAKLEITVVLDADCATARKVEFRIMLGAHKIIISCSATPLDPPKDPEPSKYSFEKEIGTL